MKNTSHTIARAVVVAVLVSVCSFVNLVAATLRLQQNHLAASLQLVTLMIDATHVSDANKLPDPSGANLLKAQGYDSRDAAVKALQTSKLGATQIETAQSFRWMVISFAFFAAALVALCLTASAAARQLKRLSQSVAVG